MISSSYDIEKFVDGVKDKDYLEVITLAEKEAMYAWRESYQRRRRMEAENAESKRYEMALKEFVYYLKSGISLPRNSNDFSENLRTLHREIQSRKPDEY